MSQFLSPQHEHLLAEWFRRVRESQFVHYECATWYGRCHLCIGIPAIILSTVVATAVFASIESKATGMQAICVGLVSVASAILTSLQTFLGFPQLAAQHRVTGASYGSIRRSLEYIQAFPPTDQLAEAFDDVRERLDNLAKDAPAIPSLLKRHIARQIQQHQQTKSLPGVALPN